MIDVTGCKAKDPKTCPYHGVVIRVNQAEIDGDLEAYFDARKDLEKAERKMRITNLLKPASAREEISKPQEETFDEKALTNLREQMIAPRSHRIPEEVKSDFDGIKPKDDEHRKDRERFVREMQRRVDYLTEAEAIVTPMESYALWLALYKAQGGKVQEKTYGDFTSKAKIWGDNNTTTGEGPTVDAATQHYGDIGWKRWTPTKNGGQIPANFGSLSMELMLYPDMTGQRLDNAHFDESSWNGGGIDTRPGWEFGHTKVFIIRRDATSPFGFVAETNQSYAYSYNDVEAFSKGKTIKDMINILGARTNLKPPSTTKGLDK